MRDFRRVALFTVVLAAGACKSKAHTSSAGSGSEHAKAAHTAEPAAKEPTAARNAAEKSPNDPLPPPSGAGAGPAVTRAVAPSTTDPAIKNPDDPHMVMLPAGPKNGKLLVFMPGTHAKAKQTSFLNTAARDGFHVINLSYPDNEPATTCGTDVNCFDAFRKKVFDGTGSHKVDVSAADSIKNRCVKLLEHLESKYPSEGWKAFLAGNDLAYSSIVFAGHSQGGGFAAYIAKQHEVARVLMFSSVVDAADGDSPTPAHWVSSGHATPTERYFGFGHTADKFAPKIAADWAALGMEKLGPRYSVDGKAPPYGNSHQLTTSIPEPDDHHAHVSVLGQAGENNEPMFLDVWRYMLLH